MVEALISGLCVAIPTVITTIVNNNKNKAVIEYRINQLTSKVHEHNQLIDRMYKVENRVTVLEEANREKRHE